MQQLLRCPTVTCIWYSNLPSSHLASLWNILCLRLCQFVFHYDEFLTTCLHLFYNPSSVLICWDLPLSSSKLWVESWCKSISGYHLSNGLLSPLIPSTARIVCIVYGNWFFPLLVFDTATSPRHCFKASLVFLPHHPSAHSLCLDHRLFPPPINVLPSTISTPNHLSQTLFMDMT